jgi:hypothetical protein
VVSVIAPSPLRHYALGYHPYALLVVTPTDTGEHEVNLSTGGFDLVDPAQLDEMGRLLVEASSQLARQSRAIRKLRRAARREQRSQQRQASRR